MAKKKSLKGKGKYARYQSENRLLKNKIRKFKKTLKKHPNDKNASARLKELGG